MRISINFNDLNFHDASVDSVSRTERQLSLQVSGVFISSEHPDALNTDWLVEQGVLDLIGVQNESAITWPDTKNTVPHTKPEHPIDEIMSASYLDGVFHFEGFKDQLPWHEWLIKADSFELTVIRASEVSS